MAGKRGRGRITTHCRMIRYQRLFGGRIDSYGSLLILYDKYGKKVAMAKMNQYRQRRQITEKALEHSFFNPNRVARKHYSGWFIRMFRKLTEKRRMRNLMKEMGVEGK